MRPRPHLILTLGRSGSNFLVNAINQADAAVNFGEVLGGWTAPWKLHDRLGATTDAAAYLDAFYDSPVRYYATLAGGNAMRLRNGRPVSWPRRGAQFTVGTKDFAHVFEARGIASYAAMRDDLFVIGLVRENTVRRVLSAVIMQHTRVAAATRTMRTPTVAIDPADFERDLAVFEAETKQLRAQLARVPSNRKLTLTYEALFANPVSTHAALRQAYDALGLRFRGQSSDHKKIVNRPLRKVIANYDELSERIVGTRFADQLAEA